MYHLWELMPLERSNATCIQGTTGNKMMAKGMCQTLRLFAIQVKRIATLQK